jgi:hypothetical protein
VAALHSNYGNGAVLGTTLPGAKASAAAGEAGLTFAPGLPLLSPQAIMATIEKNKHLHSLKRWLRVDPARRNVLYVQNVGKDAPEFVRSMAKAIQSGNWYVTSGAMVPHRSAPGRVVIEGDYQHFDDRPGWYGGGYDAKKGEHRTGWWDIDEREVLPVDNAMQGVASLLGDGSSRKGTWEYGESFPMAPTPEEARETGKGPLFVRGSENSPRGHKGLIVVATRESQGGKMENLPLLEILETLIHELAAHAGVKESRQKDFAHPNRDVNRIASEVDRYVLPKSTKTGGVDAQ